MKAQPIWCVEPTRRCIAPRTPDATASSLTRCSVQSAESTSAAASRCVFRLGAAQAQEAWPSEPIYYKVPFAACGLAEAVARAVGSCSCPSLIAVVVGRSIDEPLKPRRAGHGVWRTAGDARAGASIEEAHAGIAGRGRAPEQSRNARMRAAFLTPDAETRHRDRLAAEPADLIFGACARPRRRAAPRRSLVTASTTIADQRGTPILVNYCRAALLRSWGLSPPA